MAEAQRLATGGATKGSSHYSCDFSDVAPSGWMLKKLAEKRARARCLNDFFRITLDGETVAYACSGECMRSLFYAIQALEPDGSVDAYSVMDKSGLHYTHEDIKCGWGCPWEAVS